MSAAVRVWPPPRPWPGPHDPRPQCQARLPMPQGWRVRSTEPTPPAPSPPLSLSLSFYKVLIPWRFRKSRRFREKLNSEGGSAPHIGHTLLPQERKMCPKTVPCRPPTTKLTKAPAASPEIHHRVRRRCSQPTTEQIDPFPGAVPHGPPNTHN